LQQVQQAPVGGVQGDGIVHLVRVNETFMRMV